MKHKKNQIRFYKEYTVDIVKAEPDRIFIYETNMMNHGRNETAVVKDLPNTIPIYTKRRPCTKHKYCFFSDRIDEMLLVRRTIMEIEQLLKKGKKIGLPKKGLGTGEANMYLHSPVIFKYMTLFFQKWDSRYLRNKYRF